MLFAADKGDINTIIGGIAPDWGPFGSLGNEAKVMIEVVMAVAILLCLGIAIWGAAKQRIGATALRDTFSAEQGKGPLEYLRDIGRYLARERETYPRLPVSYFDAATEEKLLRFEKKAANQRHPALTNELPGVNLRADIDTGSAAAVLFRNWLQYLSMEADASVHARQAKAIASAVRLAER